MEVVRISAVTPSTSFVATEVRSAASGAAAIMRRFAVVDRVPVIKHSKRSYL